MLNWFSVWLPIAKIAMLHAFYLSAKICIHSFFSFYRMSYMQVHLISHFWENSSFLIIFIVHIATWTYSYQNDNKTFGKNLILRKTDLSFHQVKEELWNLWDVLLGVLEPFFSFKMSRWGEYSFFYTFSLKQPQFFTKIFLQYVYLDLLRPPPKGWLNYCMWKNFRSKMWNIVAHIWNIIIVN